MRVHENNSPQERLALRKADKIQQDSELFISYVEAAKKITETEVKKSEYRRYVRESGVRNDLAEMMSDNYLDDIFENDRLWGGLSLNYNFLKYLYNNSSQNSKEELPSTDPDISEKSDIPDLQETEDPLD